MNKPLSGAGGGGSPTIVKDSVRSQDSIEFIMGVCEGPVAGLVDGPKSFYLGDTPLVSQSGEPNFEAFELHTYAGSSSPTKVKTALGGTASNEQVGVTLAWGVPVTRTTPVSLRGKIDRLEIRLVFNQLLRTNDDGDQLEAKAEYLIQYRKTTGADTTWKSFVGSDTGGVKASMVSSWEYWRDHGDDGSWNTTEQKIGSVSLTGNLVDKDDSGATAYTLPGAVSDTSLAGYTQRKDTTYGSMFFNPTNSNYKFVPNNTAIAALTGNATVDVTFAVATSRYSYRNWVTKVTLEVSRPGYVSLKGKTGSSYVKEYTRRIDSTGYTGDYEIRVERLSTQDDDNLFISMAWESFQCIELDADLTFENLTVVRGVGSSSNQFTSIPQFSGIWAGKVVRIPSNYNPITRVYTGNWDGTFVWGYTDNPAWCLYDMILDEKYGVKKHYKRVKVDRYSFYEAAQWCDVLVPRYGADGYQPRYTYHDYIDQPREGLAACQYIASTFGAIITDDLNGTIRLKLDKATSPVQLFAPENITVEGFQYQFADITTRANDFTVTFVNPELDWAQDVRQVKNDTWIEANGRIPMDFVAVGCIDPYEAQRRAYLRMLSANTEITTVTFTTTRPGILLEPYDIIGISDPDMNWGLSGRVKSFSDYKISLRDALFLTGGASYTLTLQTASGIKTFPVKNGPAPYSTMLYVTDGWEQTNTRRNLLNYTEQFSNSAWGGYWWKPSFTTGHTAPDGSNTAISWNASTTLGSPSANTGGFLVSAPAGDAGKTVTASVWLRASAPIAMTLGTSDGAGNTTTINVTTEWQRFTVTGLVGSVNPRYFQVFENVNSNIDIYLWGPQAEFGSTATAYQKVVNTDTFYNTVSIPAGTQFALTSNTVGLVKPFRVLSINEDDKDSDHFTITAIEVNVNKQSDADNMSLSKSVKYSFENTLFPARPLRVRAESGTDHLFLNSDGRVQSRIYVTWEQDPTSFVEDFEVYYRRVDRDQWSKVKATGLDCYISDVQDGKPYEIYVKAVNLLGRKSPPSPTLTHTVVGKLQPPSTPTNLIILQDGPNIDLTWTGITDIDFSFYEIREGGSNWDTAKKIGTSKVPAFTHTGIKDGSLTYRIKAVDTSGNYSNTALSGVFMVAKPQLPTLSVDTAGPNWVLSITPNPSDPVPVKEYIVQLNGTQVFRGAATTVQGRVTWLGARTFSVRVVNSAGVQSDPTEVDLTIVAPGGVSPQSVFAGTNAVLTWTVPTTGTLPIDHYVVRDASTSTVLDDDRRATSMRIPVDWLGAKTFQVWAVDTAGNVGTKQSVTATAIGPQVESLQSRLVRSQQTFTWNGIPGTLPIKRYHLYLGWLYNNAALMTFGIAGETTDVNDGQLLATVNAETWTCPVDWNGARAFYVIAEDANGNLSPPVAAYEKVDPPPAPTITSRIVDRTIRLDWENIAAELRIQEYEIYRDGALLQRVSASAATLPIDFSGTKTYRVRAIDEAGNVGAFGDHTIEILGPSQPVLTAGFLGDQVRFEWTESVGALPIDYYRVTRGASNTLVAQIKARDYGFKANWVGAETFEVTAYDVAGNPSPPATTSLTITAPSAPSARAEVLDNNVLIRWTHGTGTLPVVATEIRKGPTFAGATVLQQVDATFAAFFEFTSATYKYWLVEKDSAGNYGTPVALDVRVNEPPDFVLQTDFNSTLNGTRTLVTLNNGALYFGVSPTATWEQHFTSETWASPQDQITAGYPLFLQPTSLSTSTYVETFDYGTVLTSSVISVTPTVQVLAGNPSLSCNIEFSANGSTWTAANGVFQTYAQNFRYVRFTLRMVSDTRDDLLAVTAINLRLNTKLRNDAGSGTAVSTDSGGTQVNFNVSFIDIQSIAVTPNSTQAYIAVYDFVDTANPTGFKVLIYDRNGVRVTAPFSWTARGY